MRVIGLTGKAGSGKSYLAREVLAKEGWVPLALAGPMKAELSSQGVIPLSESLDLEKKTERTRRVLQVYGTELGRERYNENVWCNALGWWMRWFETQGSIDKFVITDVRFPNEVKFVGLMGGQVIRVVGRGGLEGEAARHPSETALNNWVFPVVNNCPCLPMDAVRADLLARISEHYGI